MQDPMIKEERKARENHTEQFSHNLVAIYVDLKRMEREYNHEVFSFPPKLLTKASFLSY